MPCDLPDCGQATEWLGRVLQPRADPGSLLPASVARASATPGRVAPARAVRAWVDSPWAVSVSFRAVAGLRPRVGLVITSSGGARHIPEPQRAEAAQPARDGRGKEF